MIKVKRFGSQFKRDRLRERVYETEENNNRRKWLKIKQVFPFIYTIS